MDAIIDELRRATSSGQAAREVEELLLAGGSSDDVLSAVATCAARYVSPGTDPWSGFTDHSLLALEAARFLASRAPERMPQHVGKVVGTVVAGMLRAPFEWAPPAPCDQPSIANLREAVREDRVAEADAQAAALAEHGGFDQAFDTLQALGAEDFGLTGHRVVAAATVPAFARTAWGAPQADLLRALARFLSGGESDRDSARHSHELVDSILPLDSARAPPPGTVEKLAQQCATGGGAEAAAEALRQRVPPNTIADAALLAALRRYLWRPAAKGYRELVGVHITTGAHALWELCRSARTSEQAAFAALQCAEWMRSGFGGAEAPSGAELDPPREGNGHLEGVTDAIRAGDLSRAPCAVMAYRDNGGGPDGLLAGLAAAAAGPGGAGVHGVKHLHAMWRAFEVQIADHRWVALAAAARFAAWCAKNS